MIGYIHGKVEIIANDYVIIECAQVGYKVYMNTSDIAAVSGNSEDLRIYTYLHVREDNMSLYGFLNHDDLKLFEMLITVSGIGPKIAINMFAAMSGNDIKFAILSDDANTISKAPGIGKKIAQKMILELKDKFSLETVFDERFESLANTTGSSLTDEYTDALEALVSLGYSVTEAKKALNKCSNVNDSADKLIKEALKYLF